MEQAKKTLCVLDYAFQRIGGKYKGRILLALSRENILRYGELSRQLNDISSKMLTQALKELEDDYLISKEVFAEVPPRVEYRLSATGASFIPFLLQLVEWGNIQQERKALT